LINQTPTGSLFLFCFGHWNLELGIYLEFGAWDLEFQFFFFFFPLPGFTSLPLYLYTSRKLPSSRITHNVAHYGNIAPMSKTIDLHIHTLVSDGNATPLEMLSAAEGSGLATISFTDHDALGAYRHWGDVFAQAKELGIELVSGIELDSDYQDHEIHLLGYGFNLDDGPLNKHLDSTQRLRKEKVLLQLAIINRFFGSNVVDLEQVLFPLPSLRRTSGAMSVRDTLMKPHLVHAMLDQGLFSEYRAAAYWVSQNAQVPVVVPKLPLASAISLIRKAGGEAILAHPGYLVKETDISLISFLKEFVPLGLAGLEVEYPYMGSSPAFPDLESERRLINELHSLAERFELKETRGSDAHSTEALKAFANRGPVEELKG
jgi:predicted metal-dependent phosphoesterase TrpH